MNPKTPNPVSLSKAARRRSGIYGVIAAVFSRPADEALLEILRNWSFPEALLSQDTTPALLYNGLTAAREWFRGNEKITTREISRALTPEFTRLFRGVNRRTSPPPPYESVYRNEGRVFGESTENVLGKFRQFGLEPPPGEPSDHISLELEFMRNLCEKESEAWGTGTGGPELLEEERVFLQEHLMSWVPAFCEQVRKFDTTGLYKALADVTEGWINYDRNVIEGSINGFAR